MESIQILPMSRNEVLEMISEDMLSSVSSNPMYVQCLLHIKHYRDFHKKRNKSSGKG
jgi:hypothetical protein